MNLHLAAARRGLLAALALTIIVLGAAPGLALAANRAPTIGGKPATTATVGKSYSLKPTVSDPEGEKLTFTISNKPSWATFNTADGTPKARRRQVMSARTTTSRSVSATADSTCCLRPSRSR